MLTDQTMKTDFPHLYRTFHDPKCIFTPFEAHWDYFFVRLQSLEAVLCLCKHRRYVVKSEALSVVIWTQCAHVCWIWSPCCCHSRWNLLIISHLASSWKLSSVHYYVAAVCEQGIFRSFRHPTYFFVMHPCPHWMILVHVNWLIILFNWKFWFKSAPTKQNIAKNILTIVQIRVC